MVRNFVQRFNILSEKGLARFVTIILGVCLCFALAGSVGQPVFANDGSVDTTFFGNIKDDGNGCGVYMVLNYAIDFLAFGVGIAAVIGIVISGITYMTAKDNQERTIKAKRRIYEIVIGLMAYLALWSLLSFLLPGGVLNDSPQCEEGTDSGSFFTTPNESSSPDARKDRWNHYGYTRRYASSSGSGGDFSTEMTEGSGNMLTSALNVAEIFVKNRFMYGGNVVKKISEAKIKKNGRATCASYVSLVAQEAGLLKNGEVFYTTPKLVSNRSALSKNFTITSAGGATVASLVKDKRLVPGDIIGLSSQMHTMIYAGRKNGKFYYYSGGKNATTNSSSPGGRYTNVTKFFQTYGSKGAKGSYGVSWIIHPKGT